MIDLKNLTRKELRRWVADHGEKAFRGDQIFSWISHGVLQFEKMSNLSNALRRMLSNTAGIGSLYTVTEQCSAIDGTRKYLFELPDGNRIESVFMKYRYGNSVCISSQAGCRMGCVFCASTRNGLVRNLTAGEMLDQILCVQRETGERVSRVVVMGTGEPLENETELNRFLEMVHDKAGLGISMRHLTVSTCGLIPGIRRLGIQHPQVNLAVSLHAADQVLRSRIMPVSKTYDVDSLLVACRHYADHTGRRITFEYALIRGWNDTRPQIRLLAGKLQQVHCHVNLIPLNPVEETGLHGTSRERAGEIAAFLQQKGIPATVRRRLGADIDAACGQLRLKRGS